MGSLLFLQQQNQASNPRERALFAGAISIANCSQAFQTSTTPEYEHFIRARG